MTDPYQLYDAQKEFGEEHDHRVPTTEEVKEFGEFGNPVSIDSKFSEASIFQSHMHFDDSVESIADSDLEDGELQKMLTSPLYAQKASAKQELHVESHSKCIGEPQRQTEEQRLALQDAQYGFVESRRPQVRQRRSSPKYSNPKDARNGRN